MPGDGDTRGPGCVTGRGYSGHGGCCCFFVLALAVFAGIRGRGDAQARTSAGYFFFISFILLVILSRFVVFFFCFKVGFSLFVLSQFAVLL